MFATGTVRNALFAVAVIASLAGIAAIPLVMQRFGREDGSPRSLSDTPRPEIPGEMLYREHDGCLVRAAASGATRERLFCEIPATPFGGGGGRFAWVDDQTVAYVVDQPRIPGLPGQNFDANVVVMDLAMNIISSGERPVGTPGDAGVDGLGRLQPLSPGGESASITEDGRLLVGQRGAEREVANFDATGLELQVVSWSPDGQWLALAYRDSEGIGRSELWIVSRDGKTRGTLAKGLGDVDVSWRIAGIGTWPLVVE